MNIYLAAKYERHPEMREYRAQLEAAGHRVTSRWLNTKDYEGTATQVQAAHDLSDIIEADLLIAFMGNAKSSGRHFEAGFAFGLGKQVWIVGEPEGIFYTLPSVRQFETLEQLERAI